MIAAAVTTVVVAVRDDDGSGSSRSSDGAATNPNGVVLKPALKTHPPAMPARWTGPQGRTGQFVVTCRYSHSAPDDPIVHFSMPGMSHMHDFYGSTKVDASSTARSLLGTPTTCNKTPDTAAYWQPALIDHGKQVTPIEVAAYYRAARGVDPKDVQTMPLGLAMIAGDSKATEPQAGEATGWTCGSRTKISDTPPECPNGAPLHLVLTFPDCWDGEYVDSEDHISHVAYSADGECPDGFDVHIPQLTTSTKFPIAGPGHDLMLGSGNVYSAHGDFFNGWDAKGLKREIEACIHRGVVCDLASNREEEALFQANP